MSDADRFRLMRTSELLIILLNKSVDAIAQQYVEAELDRRIHGPFHCEFKTSSRDSRVCVYCGRPSDEHPWIYRIYR